MILRFNIFSPGNTGAPAYTICGQAASVISNVNMNVEILIAGVSIFSTSDLSTAPMPVTPAIITPTINLVTFTYSALAGFNIVLDAPLMEDSTTMEVIVSKTGYIGYDNILDIYGYDLGIDSIVTNNVPIDIYLINETNNVVSGRQTRAFSNFTAYRKPFTNEVHYYNMVGTQGIISYTNQTAETNLTGNQRGQTCTSDEVEIEQTIDIYDGFGAIISTCSSSIIVDSVTWFPTYNTTISCEIECGDCVSDQSANNYATTEVDFTNVTPVNIDDVQVYPTSQLTNDIVHEIYDYTGLLASTQTTNLSIGSYPIVFGNIIFNFTIPALGDNVIKTRYVVEDVIDCYITNIVSACSWFNVSETETCGELDIMNCSFTDATLIVSAMQTDQTFSVISTTTLLSLDSTTISLAEDNVYTISLDDGTGPQILVVFNYCAFKECILNYLTTLVCSTPCGDCQAGDVYNFNALMINAHTYFMMLNNEYNFNNLYTALSPAKVTELYDVKQILDRMAEYCTTSCSSGCKTCKG